MRISVSCPQCQTSYQLEESLRGKRIRCPNSMCRAVFTVQETGAETTPAPPGAADPPRPVRRATADVQDLLPLLPAEEAVDEAPPAQAKPVVKEEDRRDAEPSWENLPPPVRRSDPASATVEPKPDSDVGTQDAQDWHEAPPVRGAVSPEDPEPDTSAAAPLEVRQVRKRSLTLLVGLVVLLGAGAGITLWLLQGREAEEEALRFTQAEKLYRDQEFADALAVLQKLYRDYPESALARKYRFLAELSDVRAGVFGPDHDAEQVVRSVGRLGQFLEVYKNTPILMEYQKDLWETLHRLAKDVLILAEQKKDAELLVLARRVWKESGAFEPPSGVNVLQVRTKFDRELERIDQLLARHARRLEALGKLKDCLARPSAQTVQEGRRLLREDELRGDDEAEALFGQLLKSHRESVIYTVASAKPQSPLPEEDTVPSLLVAAPLGGAGKEIVFALARGVLYALDAARGEVRWARRIGVDTGRLPLRLPATPVSPETVLVVSSDRLTLSAVEALSGSTLWQHLLADACLGQPVLVGRNLFVPTYGGIIEEIDTTGGRLLGHYQVDPPLVAGGARQEGSHLVCVAGDQHCVYLLDVATRTCAGILYTQHAGGSLRGPPLILGRGSDKSASENGWLVLTLGEGPDHAMLRAYALPIHNPDQKPEAEVRVTGWPWFAPWHDGEKLALTSDAGIFAAFGIRQKGSRDPLLFPLFEGEFACAGDGKTRIGRAQVVHAGPDFFHVLTQGRLFRLQTGTSLKQGPQVRSPWSLPPELGSPLHEAQVLEDGSLCLVTQSLAGPSCLATLVEPLEGKILWQRRLGLVCQGQPLAVEDRVWVPAAAGLMTFDAEHIQPLPGSFWRIAQPTLDIDEAKHSYAHLLRGAKGVYQVLGAEKTLQLTYHEVDAAKPTTLRYPLATRPSGVPDVVGDGLVLPLANGVLTRVSLKEDKVTTGPNWRAPGADEQSPGYVVSLGEGLLVVSDGSRGLTTLRWPDPTAWKKIAQKQLDHRIVAPPVLLASQKGKGSRIAVADAADNLTLLDGEGLQVVRRWSLQGKLTAGPFALGDGLACVVGKHRLVWLDPDKDAPVWEYAFVAEIVGPPQLVEGSLIVADLAGRFLALNPATGHPRGPGYTLRAQVAPAAAPVLFGPGRLFAPLTDGTIMLLPLQLLTADGTMK